MILFNQWVQLGFKRNAEDELFRLTVTPKEFASSAEEKQLLKLRDNAKSTFANMWYKPAQPVDTEEILERR